MKRCVFVLMLGVVCVIGSLPVAAQDWFRDPTVLESLKLTDQQKAEGEKILLNVEKEAILRQAKVRVLEIELNGLVSEATPNIQAVDAKIEEMAGLRKEQFRSDVHLPLECKAILTPEQKQTLAGLQPTTKIHAPNGNAFEQGYKELRAELQDYLDEQLSIAKDQVQGEMARAREEVRSWLAQQRKQQPEDKEEPADQEKQESPAQPEEAPPAPKSP